MQLQFQWENNIPSRNSLISLNHNSQAWVYIVRLDWDGNVDSVTLGPTPPMTFRRDYLRLQSVPVLAENTKYSPDTLRACLSISSLALAKPTTTSIQIASFSWVPEKMSKCCSSV
jgi:hypothetical protein